VAPKQFKPGKDGGTWLRPPAHQDILVLKEAWVQLDTPLGEPLVFAAHCGLHAKFFCHVVNACDLSSATTGVTRVLDLLAFSVSDELCGSDHGEANMQVNLQVFRSWHLQMTDAYVECADAICPSGAKTSFSIL
jgi:hypothetical protein